MQGLLHTGVSVIAQLRREAHHSGLADADPLAQLAGRHKGRLVIVLQNVGGNALLSLGKLWHLLANGMQHVVIQPHRFPSSLVIPHLLSISTCQMEGSPNAGYAPDTAAAAARKAPPDGTSGGSAGSCLMDDHLQHRRLPFLGQTAHLCRLNGLPLQHPHPGEPFLGPSRAPDTVT